MCQQVVVAEYLCEGNNPGCHSVILQPVRFGQGWTDGCIWSIPTSLPEIAGHTSWVEGTAQASPRPVCGSAVQAPRLPGRPQSALGESGEEPASALRQGVGGATAPARPLLPCQWPPGAALRPWTPACPPCLLAPALLSQPGGLPLVTSLSPGTVSGHQHRPARRAEADRGSEAGCGHRPGFCRV